MLLLVVVFSHSLTLLAGHGQVMELRKTLFPLGMVTVGLGKLDAAGQVQEQRTLLRDRLDGLASPKIQSRGTAYTEVPGYF